MNDSIDLTNLNGTEQSRCDTMWIPNLGLRKEDEKILQSSHAWLNDSLINSSHNLLRKQFPNIKGLANSLYVAAKKSPQCPLTYDCIQIHQTGHSHWVVSSVSKGKITVYDSMLPNIAPQLSSQLLHIYGDKEDVHKPIRVTVTVCQEQIGESDCGLFAIANALALAKGILLQNIKFFQSHMRSHLHQCFQNQLLTMFPHETIEHLVQSKTFIISR